MGLLVSGLGMMFFAIIAVIIAVILVAIYVAIFIGIAALIVGGSTAAPALVFALLFTMGKSENLIVSVLIFAASYYFIKRLIRYRRVENAILVHLAVVASTLSAFSVKIAVSFLFGHTPAWILLVLIVGEMIFMLSPVIANDRQKGKEGYPVITRIIASVLYGSAFIALLGSLAVVFEMDVPSYFTALLYVLWVLSGVVAYFLDVKMTKDNALIRTIQKLPVRIFLKGCYDKYSTLILAIISKYK